MGILLDRGGKDEFTAGTFAQGAAALGCGLLQSDGNGDDRYEIGRLGQGLGRVGGLGVLRDRGGNDRYVVRPQYESMYSRWTGGRKVHWSFAQGCGDLNDSYGILVDLMGDDRYEAGKRTARGFATNTAKDRQPTEKRPYADYGIFLDLRGKDTYLGPAGGADGKTWIQKATGRGVGMDLPEED